MEGSSPVRHPSRACRPPPRRLLTAHLTDPDLSPATIGDAFDLAVRSVHGAFAGSGHTVADLIRRRRIETVQAILAGRVIMPQLTELVQLSGFHNPTHLVRAFQAVTGAPIRTWFDRQPESLSGS